MATVAPTNVVPDPVNQLETLLTCSVCLETLNDPRTLPCFHSFCKFCLEKFVKGHREKALGLGKKIENFNCPTCRSEFILKPQEEVAGMGSSHFIRNMLEVVQIQRRAKVSKCSRCQETAVSRCITCEMFMCESCFEAHESWPSNKKHTVLSVSELTQPENQAKIRSKLHCKKHENKTLKFYCETCKELICTHCMMLIHLKQNHSCLSVDEVAEKQREALKSSCATLDEKLAEGKAALEAIKKVSHFVEDNAKKVKDRIIQQKEEILKTVAQKLDEKAKFMINEVDKVYKTKKTELSKQHDEIKAYVDKVESTVHLPRNLLEKGNIEEVLSSQKMIDENIKKVKNECPENWEPVNDGNIQYESKMTDDVNVDDILDKLGEIVGHVFPLSRTSIILNGQHHYVKQMEEWMKGLCEWRLCYQASKDGWSAEDFHRCCDNKGPTVTLVKVGDYIFGGYTNQDWTGNCYKQSNSSFLFSLRNKDNLPPFKSVVYQNIQYAIYSHPSYGPTFGGGHDLHISNNANTNQQSGTYFGHTYRPPPGYNYNTEQTKNLLAGTYKFTPTEIEVFH